MSLFSTVKIKITKCEELSIPFANNNRFHCQKLLEIITFYIYKKKKNTTICRE